MSSEKNDVLWFKPPSPQPTRVQNGQNGHDKKRNRKFFFRRFQNYGKGFIVVKYFVIRHYE